jgi:hypothetical protein
MNLTGAQIIVPNAVGVSGAPKIANDAIDVAMSTLSSYVFAYIRAKRWTSPAASGLVDRTGNPIKTENMGQTYTSVDSTFGGLPSISVAACADTPYLVTNRGAAPPSTFTFLTALQITATKSSTGHCLVSLTNGSTNGDTGSLGLTVYADATPDGHSSCQLPGPQTIPALSGFPVNDSTPCIFVCSYDNVTKKVYIGLNGLPTYIGTLATTAQSVGSDDVFRLFGYVNNNTYNMLGKFETVAIFNACAGEGGAIDPLITALIAQMRSVYGF